MLVMVNVMDWLRFLLIMVRINLVFLLLLFIWSGIINLVLLLFVCRYGVRFVILLLFLIIIKLRLFIDGL